MRQMFSAFQSNNDEQECKKKNIDHVVYTELHFFHIYIVQTARRTRTE